MGTDCSVTGVKSPLFIFHIELFFFSTMKNIFRPGLFKGHVAIVTGGGSGIGLAIASSLGELGAKVAICGRKKERLDAAEKALREKGIETFTGICDIRENEQIGAFVDDVGKNLGHTSILINNAGGQFPTTAQQVSKNGWEAVIKNNLTGTFFFSQIVANKHMIPAKKGRIVNIIANVRRGFPAMVHTGAARAGVDNITKTLAVEWAFHNIQVNSIAPGVIISTGTEQYPKEILESSRVNTPAKRFGKPEEVAALTTYLSSDAAAYVTGETWYIDGGASIWGAPWPIPDHKNSPTPDL
jgi:citronellol/citronellal dehydrogenase